MKYVKRVLWIAAWSGWLCAGVGLHRELPRDLGPPIRTLPVGDRFDILGFVGTSNEIAVCAKRTTPNHDVQIFDAETGECVRTAPGAKSDFVSIRLGDERPSVRFAEIVRFPDDTILRQGLFVLDLTTGEWRRVSHHLPQGSYSDKWVSLHSSKPWVAFCTQVGTRQDEFQAVVANFRTGQEVFARARPVKALLSAFFLPKTDKLVVAAIANEQTAPFVEVWNLAGTPVMKKRLEGVSMGWPTAATSSGRVAFQPAQNASEVDVYDLEAARYLYSKPPHKDREPIRNFDRSFWTGFGTTRPLSLDSTGSHFLNGWDAQIVDLNTGTEVWKARRFESPLWSKHDNLFCTMEVWSFFWDRWVADRSYITYVVRDMAGNLVVRTASDKGLDPTAWNAARTLAVEPDGSVYALPHRVNYSLLAVCQAILAAPLLSLWALLRWRRRKSVRS